MKEPGVVTHAWHPALGRQRQEDDCKLKANWYTQQDPVSKIKTNKSTE